MHNSSVGLAKQRLFKTAKQPIAVGLEDNDRQATLKVIFIGDPVAGHYRPEEKKVCSITHGFISTSEHASQILHLCRAKLTRKVTVQKFGRFCIHFKYKKYDYK